MLEFLRRALIIAFTIISLSLNGVCLAAVFSKKFWNCLDENPLLITSALSPIFFVVLVLAFLLLKKTIKNKIAYKKVLLIFIINFLFSLFSFIYLMIDAASTI